LTEKAIANSSELVTLDEQIALIDKRLALAGNRIEHTSKKRWTNYISLDPLRIAANVLGGGDVQRDNIAIADLEKLRVRNWRHIELICIGAKLRLNRSCGKRF
jgi:hypothetical protein